MEIKSIVRDKAYVSKYGYTLFFIKGSCNPNYTIYQTVKVGDPVVLKVGPVIKSIYGFTYSIPPKSLNENDSFGVAIICFLATLALLISANLLFSKTHKAPFLEGKVFKGYVIFLLFGYCITAYFIYLACITSLPAFPF